MLEINKIYQGDCLEVMKTIEDNSIDAVVTDPPYGLSFMGKKWDYDVPKIEIWQECLRVLKPGGYLLSFAGTRTQHRMAVRIEDAGFEIRDMIAWIYGSGFPKSLNIGKAIQKLNGVEPIGFKENKDAKFFGDGWNATPRQLFMPPPEGEAKQWEGWGTALKPALEPITVARKPIEGNVAQNCLKWGVGGINIDESRVGTEIRENPQYGNGGDLLATSKGGEQKWDGTKETVSGRFPANLIHDGSDEVVDLFPNTKSTNNVRHNKVPTGENGIYGKYEAKDSFGFSDSGSAARFFYCAKASKSERNMGCDGLEEKNKAGKDFRPNHSIKAELGEDGNPFGRWGKIQNNHPTVKPIALMEYLIKLVTPKGGIVLDPFAGSGSTLIAAKKNGFQYIGIELTEEYIPIIEARLSSVRQQTLL